MMNQPLRRVDPLGRSAPPTATRRNWPWPPSPTDGSVSPIRDGSERAIVDTSTSPRSDGGMVGHGGNAPTGRAGAFGIGGTAGGGSNSTVAGEAGTGGGLAPPCGEAVDETGLVVAPSDGNDSNAGTSSAPFKTIAHARDALRPLLKGMSSDRVVYLRAGKHELESTLQFDGRDSGQNGHTVHYRAYPCEHPVITSGVQIGPFTNTNGVLHASAKGLRFRQLYVNGRRATRARSPGFGVVNRLLGWIPDGMGGTRIRVDATEVPPMSIDPTNPPEIVVLMRWTAWRARIADFTSNDAGTIDLSLRDPERVIMNDKPDPAKDPGRPYWFENAPELVDQPGEWELDASRDQVLYFPVPGETATNIEAIVPTVTTLVSLAGDPGAELSGISFEGIGFEHSNWTVPDQYGHVDHQSDQWNSYFTDYSDAVTYPTEAAVELRKTHGVTITGCAFSHVGSVALDLAKGCQDNHVVGNSFVDISGNGIQEGQPALAAAQEPDRSNVEARNEFSNNVITSVGQDYTGAVAILAGFAQNDTFSHNQVMGTPYTAMTIGWQWDSTATVVQGHTVEANDIQHAVSLLSDSAGVYTLGRQVGTKIEQNFMHEIYWSSTADASNAVAVYTDEGSSGITIQNNVTQQVFGLMNAPPDKLVIPQCGSVPCPSDAPLNSIDFPLSNQNESTIGASGPLPEFQAARPWPVPTPWAGNLLTGDVHASRFDGTINVTFTYAPNATIRYTLDGSQPTATSPVVPATGVPLSETTTITARGFLPSGITSGSFSGRYERWSEVEEIFGRPDPSMSFWAEVAGNCRTKSVVAPASGLTWAGYTPECTTSDAAMTLDYANRLMFTQNPATGMHTLVHGAYVYATFTQDTTSETRVVTGFDRGSVELTVDSMTNSSLPLGLRFIVRDRQKRWYLSTRDQALQIRGQGGYTFDIPTAHWEEFDVATSLSFNHVTGERAGIAIATQSASTEPDLSQIDAGGVYIDYTASSDTVFAIERIAWLGR